MRTELLLKFTFEASHSLADYEVPHPHLWKLEVAVVGKPKDGRILDIVALRSRFQKLVDSLSLTYLNETPLVSSEVREFPTCETLSLFFTKELGNILTSDFVNKNPTVQLSWVSVAICNMDQTELGAVRLTLN